jgi:hypothetical protein
VIKKKSISVLIFGILAFAAAIYILFFKGKDINSGSGGLSRFKVETFQAGSGWAYRIRQDTTAVIEQKFIPGVAGTTGFQTEQQALSTGRLVIQKLDRGIFPPTISTRELDSLGVKY